MSDDEAFIRAIVEKPGDALPRLIYADWLDENHDPRSVYLRAEHDAVRTGDASKLKILSVGLDSVWVARVSRPPVGVCCDRLRFSNPGEKRPKLTPADLDWVERRFQLTLSADYRAFLLNYNGGNPKPGRFRYPGRVYGDGLYEQVFNFNSVFSAAEPKSPSDFDLVCRLIHLDEYRHDALRWAGELHRNLMVVGVMPRAELDWLCLGCRGDPIGKVYAMAAWLFDDSQEQYHLVASTFAEFLGLMSASA